MDPYEKLTPILAKNDAMTRFKNQELFFDSVFQRYPIQSILDCSCGAGDYVDQFLKKGFNCFGSDISETTINYAKMQYPTIKSHFKVGDFRKLDQYFSQSFDCILCWATSFPHMMTDNDASTALKSMYHQLNPSGILMIQQVIHDNTRFDDIPILNNEEESLVYSFINKGDIVEIRILYLKHTKEEQTFQNFKIHYNGTLTQSKMERLLHEVGFEQIHFYGNFDFTPYQPSESSQLIIIAEK